MGCVMTEQQRRFLELLKQYRSDDMPEYRSAEFDALPEDDPRRAESMRRAADRWHQYWTFGAWFARLQQELLERDQDVLCRIREASWAISAGGDWPALASEPEMAVVMRRRAEVTVPRRCQARNCRTVVSVPFEHRLADIWCRGCRSRGRVGRGAA